MSTRPAPDCPVCGKARTKKHRPFCSKRCADVDLGRWFTGVNDANRPVYDPPTGRTYDGIVGPGKVNPNSGAESTIEGLFALTALAGTTLP